MKILHVYKNYYPVAGGIEGHIKLLCGELARNPEFDVTVLVANTKKKTVRETIAGVEVIKAGENLTLARTPISWRLWVEMSRIKADITHLHFPYPFGELGYLLLGNSKKLVVTYHSDIVIQKRLLKLYEPFLWRLLRRADCITASSPRYVASSPYLSKFADKCAISPLGIDLSRFQVVASEPVAGIRARYGSPLILFVGKFRYYKGLQHLVEAMKMIRGHLVLVGSGPLEEKVRSQVAASGLGDRIHLVGEVGDQELAAYYHSCDVFVLPASQRSEAFGIVQLEAMACGKPVVCTEIGTGTSWVNIHKETGLVVEPANPTALADAINSLVEDAALRRRLGRNARERVRREFSKEAMARRIVDIYDGLPRS
ncbi:MAG: glycosyltransferase [Chloroflexi bacterium]|nr:glycosyltransferase [Chloroflexota bacterium]